MISKIELMRPDLRFPFPPQFAESLTGRRVSGLGRRGKFLIAHVEGGPALICHLGMSGSFRIEAGASPGAFHHERSKKTAHDHVIFHLRKGGDTTCVVFNDPRRFGFMLLCAADALNLHPMLSGLGIEPTGNALSGELLADLVRNKKAPLKAALLDQSLIAGLGNIYVSEALWRSRLSPRRTAGTIAGPPGKPSPRASRLADAVREVIADAIAAGGSTLRDHIQTDGSLGYFQHRFSVYDREGKPCAREGCAGTIKRIVQSGRSTFYCPTCQR